MLVVMQQGAAEAQIQAVIDRMVGEGYDVHRSTGVMHTVLGGVGGKVDVDLEVFEVMEGVKEAHRIASPYKLASRNFTRLSRRSRPAVMVARLRCVSTAVSPWPGKCFAVVSTKLRLSEWAPSMKALTCAATSCGFSPKERMLMIGLSGLLLTSATG